MPNANHKCLASSIPTSGTSAMRLSGILSKSSSATELTKTRLISYVSAIIAKIPRWKRLSPEIPRASCQQDQKHPSCSSSMGIIERKRFRMTCRFPFAIMLYPFCKHRKKFRLYRNISTTSRSRWSNGSRKGYTLKGVAEERGMAGIPQERKSPTPNIPGGASSSKALTWRS